MLFINVNLHLQSNLLSSRDHVDSYDNNLIFSARSGRDIMYLMFIMQCTAYHNIAASGIVFLIH